MLDKNKTLEHDCGCGCADCDCGRRNRFFRGKRMKADDFAIEQWYGIERRRIINRHVIGAGVVAGFAMEAGGRYVGPGFALDAHGREIVLAHRTALRPDNLFLAERSGTDCRTLPLDRANPEAIYLLSIHYAERRFGDARVAGGCGCDEPEKNYVCETGIFSLTEICEPCPCGEEPCDWHCDCRIVDACDRDHPPEQDRPDQKPPDQKPPYQKTPEPPLVTDKPYAAHDVHAAAEESTDWPADDGDLPGPDRFEPTTDERGVVHATRGGRGPHACLCHRLSDREVDCAAPPLCRWKGYFTDPAHGVALACVRVRRTGNECDPVDIVIVDACGPRRFVKSNDLLYDFIRGCDLTRISWVSWHAWHRERRPMPWLLFARLFYLNQGDPRDPKNGWTAFVLRFSGPVFKETIRHDSVVIRAVTTEEDTGWRLVHRIPIVRIDDTPHTPRLDPALTDQIRVYVSPDWIHDEIVGKSTKLSCDVFDIEFELDGFGILDCHRQPLDAEAIGLAAAPTGNGSPGGIYRSPIRVAAKPRRQSDHPRQQFER